MKSLSGFFRDMAIVLASVLATAGARLYLNRFLGADAPIILFVLPVMVSSWLCGYAWGLVATVLSAVVGTKLFLPSEMFVPLRSQDMVRMSIFLFIGVVISLLNERLRRSRRQALQARDEAWEAMQARDKEKEALRLALAEADRERRRLEAVVDAIPVGLVLADAEGKVVRSNHAAEDVWGVLPETEGIADYALYKGYWPETGKPLEPQEWPMARALQKGETTTGETLQIERFDGRLATILISGAPIYDGDGLIMGGVVAMMDATEWKATERQLRMLAAVVESSLDFVSICSPQMVPFYINEAGRRMVGIEPNTDLRSLRVLDLFCDEDRLLLEREALPALRAEGHWMGAAHFCNRKSGARVPTLWNAFAIRDARGDVMAWASVSPDLGPLREVEASLGKARADAEKRARELEGVIEAMQDAVFVFDAQGILVRCNPEARNVYGFNPERESDPSPNIARLGIRDGRGRPLPIEEMPSRRACRGESMRGVPLLIRVSDADERAVLANASPVRVGDAVMGSVAVWHDITERRHFEIELARAKTEAEEANRAKSIFLANMSHEIRTPLNAILGFAELLREASFSEAERIEFLGHILRSGRQLVALIDDILDLSKVEAERLTIAWGPVSLPALLAELENTFQNRAQEGDIRFSIEPQPSLPQVIISDGTRLRQVLFNVVGNALKFTPGGGEVSVRVTHSPQRHLLFFSVVDTGIGIPRGEHERIFEPFQQAENSRTRLYGGTGLGLTLSRRIARMLGGDLVLAQSEVGQGSTFVVSVEARQASGAVAEGESGERDSRHHSKESLEGLRILLAEDMPDAQLLMRRFLEGAGATVEVVGNGREALSLALDSRFDAILMDVRMPVMDGLSATRELRKRGYSGKIFALTAHALQEERAKAMEAGCDAQISKPVSFPHLVSVLRGESFS